MTAIFLVLVAIYFDSNGARDSVSKNRGVRILGMVEMLTGAGMVILAFFAAWRDFG